MTAVPARAQATAPLRRFHPDDVLSGIGLGAVLCVGWPMLLALRGPQPPQLPVLVAHVAGMLAGYGVVVLLFLMSRTRPSNAASVPTGWPAGMPAVGAPSS